MKAGQTELLVGTKVKISNIKGEDKNLNGLIGAITHPFAFGETKKGWVGVYLDGDKSFYGDKINVHIAELEIIQ